MDLVLKFSNHDTIITPKIIQVFPCQNFGCCMFVIEASCTCMLGLYSLNSQLSFIFWSVRKNITFESLICIFIYNFNFSFFIFQEVDIFPLFHCMAANSFLKLICRFKNHTNPKFRIFHIPTCIGTGKLLLILHYWVQKP